VNSRLLDRLSRANFGQTEFARPDENLEAHIGRLYSRISAPVLTEVAVTFDWKTSSPKRGRRQPGVSAGGPRSVRGRAVGAGRPVPQTGRRQSGRPRQAGQGRAEVRFPAKLVEKSNDESYAFVEKLWAMRRIGEIIDELDLKGKNDELIQELVTLSTKHGILTPYTSFLADDNPPPGLTMAPGAPGGARPRRALSIGPPRPWTACVNRRAAPPSRNGPRSGCFRMPRWRRWSPRTSTAP